MSVGSVLLAILGVALLMVVHESGHYFAARYFGMRVLTYSIGFGPTLWQHKPEGSPTTFQIAIVPFLAYVRIDGMNPFEECDPNDKGNYQNASLWARIVTITAGSAANYLFASVLIFIGLMVGGTREFSEDTARIDVVAGGPAERAGLRTGDRVVAIDGKAIGPWSDLPGAIAPRGGDTLDVEIERGAERLHLFPLIEKDDAGNGRLQVRMYSEMVDVPLGKALLASVKAPPMVAYALFQGISHSIVNRISPELSGPLGIVKEVSAAVEMGPGDAFRLLGNLSAYLGVFNLMPFPALDGGRLLFLLYEAIARRKVNAKAEAMVHVAGLLMFLTLMAVVTFNELTPGSSSNRPSAPAPAASAPAAAGSSPPAGTAPAPSAAP